MTTHANVKPLMHWLIYHKYTVRITQRAPLRVDGILTMSEGPVNFHYDPINRIVHLPDQTIAINEYGWEIEAP